MIRLLILRFWPVLIPLIVYLIWLNRVGRKATIAGKPIIRFRDGPWFWMLITSLLIAVACFAALGIESSLGEKGAYTPPHMEGSEFVSGKVTTP